MSVRQWAQGSRGEQGLARRFGLRMLVSVALALTVMGIGGSVLISRELRDQQIASFAQAHRADVESFKAIGKREPDPKLAVREVDEVIDSVAARPGTIEALLIDEKGIVRAASDDAGVGERESDTAVNGVLRSGSYYAGHEVDSGQDARNFEFVGPVELPGGRYAYEVSYDHVEFDAQLAAIRRAMGLIVVIMLFGGGIVFYVVGGRPLMRSQARDA